jgi:uncharacterized membrane protein YhaH (DUF805 family)
MELWNNKIVKLMFDWNGKISRYEFISGFIIIISFALIGLSIASGDIFFLMRIVTTFGVNQEAVSYSWITKSVINIVLPFSIPIGFASLYSIIILTIKRSRGLVFSKKWIILSSILSAYFIGIINNIPFLLSMLANINISFYDRSANRISLSVLIIMSTFFLICLLNIIYLIFLKRNDEKNFELKSNNLFTLNQFEFIYKIGKMILVLLIYAVCGTIIFTISFLSIESSDRYNLSLLFAVVSVIFTLIYLSVYFSYILKRCRDSILPNTVIPFIIIISFVLSISTSIYIYLNHGNLSVVLFQILFTLNQKLSVIIMILLFFLPSKKNIDLS